jgi:hypothetical protein
LIEENARIFRIDDWDRPIIAPKIDDKIMHKFKIEELIFVSRQFASRINGANFCQVRTIRLLIHENPSTI